MYGLTIDGAYYAWSIVRGEKTIETRTLKARKYMDRLLGERVAIILNGKVIGYVTIVDRIDYGYDVEWFRRDEKKHLVRSGTRYDINASKGKCGYILSNACVEPDVYQATPFDPHYGYGGRTFRLIKIEEGK